MFSFDSGTISNQKPIAKVPISIRELAGLKQWTITCVLKLILPETMFWYVITVLGFFVYFLQTTDVSLLQQQLCRIHLMLLQVCSEGSGSPDSLQLSHVGGLIRPQTAALHCNIYWSWRCKKIDCCDMLTSMICWQIIQKLCCDSHHGFTR